VPVKMPTAYFISWTEPNEFLYSLSHGSHRLIEQRKRQQRAEFRCRLFSLSHQSQSTDSKDPIEFHVRGLGEIGGRGSYWPYGRPQPLDVLYDTQPAFAGQNTTLLSSKRASKKFGYVGLK
jgi:hypothetical protein